MSTTKTRSQLRALDEANPHDLASVIAKMALGTMLSPLKVTFASLTAAAAIDITTAASKTAATIVGAKTLDTGEMLPAILSVTALRVTAVDTGATGPRSVTDAGGTAGAPGANGPGIALLSDDGKTLTFEGTVTGFVLEYIPRPKTDMSTQFPPL